MPACRSPSSAKRAGTVAIVQSRGSTSSTSSQVIGVETVASGDAADRVGAGDRVVAGVLVVVDEHLARVAVLAPPGRGRRRPGRGARPRGRRRARPGARRVKPQSRLDPHVDVQARCRRRSWASRPRRARRAPRARRARPGARVPNGQSGIGSRSIRHSSGRSVSARREFHGWNSTVDICTAQITLASSVTHSSSACGRSAGS